MKKSIKIQKENRFPFLLFFIMVISYSKSYCQITPITITGNLTPCPFVEETYKFQFSAANVYTVNVSGNGILVSNKNGILKVRWQYAGTTGYIDVAGVSKANSSMKFQGTSVINIAPAPLKPSIEEDVKSWCFRKEKKCRPDAQAPFHPREKCDGAGWCCMDSFVATQSICAKACINSTSRYYAKGNFATSTFSWEIPGNNYVSITPGGTAGNYYVDVLWGSLVQQETIILTEIPPAGASSPCMETNSLCVELSDEIKPLATVLANTLPITQYSACPNQNIVFQDLTVYTGNEMEVEWNFGDGKVESFSGGTQPTTITHAYSSPLSYNVVLKVKTQCGCTSIYKIKVDVLNVPGPEIICPSTVCANQIMEYSTIANCKTYNWNIINGTILSPQPYGKTIKVQWGDPLSAEGFISLETPSCGVLCPVTTIEKIPIIPTTLIINGPSTVCEGDRIDFSTKILPSTLYTWTATINGNPIPTFPTDDHTFSMMIPHGSGGQTLDIQLVYSNSFVKCGGSANKQVSILEKLVITSPVNVCKNATINFSTTKPVAEFKVSFPNGTTQSFFNVSSGSVNSGIKAGNIKIAIIDPLYCSDPKNVDVIEVPTPNIEGKDVVCPNTHYTFFVNPYPANTSIIWNSNSSNGMQMAGNAFMAKWNLGSTSNPFVSAQLVMNAAPGCSSLVQQINPSLNVINLDFTGPTDACSNSSSQFFPTYDEGDNYTWSVDPQGGIFIPQKDNSGLIEWGILPSNIIQPTYDIRLDMVKCGTTYTVIKSINNNNIPILITGPLSLCTNLPGVYNVTAIPGAVYEWLLVPTGTNIPVKSGSSLTPSISVSTNDIGSYDLIVKAKYAGVCESTESINITVNGVKASASSACISSGTTGTIDLVVMSNNPFKYKLTSSGPWISAGPGLVSIPSVAIGKYIIEVEDISTGCITFCNEVEVKNCNVTAPGPCGNAFIQLVVAPSPAFNLIVTPNSPNCNTYEVEVLFTGISVIKVNGASTLPTWTGPSTTKFTLNASNAGDYDIYIALSNKVIYCGKIHIDKYYDFEVKPICNPVPQIIVNNLSKGPITPPYTWDLTTISGTLSQSVISPSPFIIPLPGGGPFTVTMTNGTCIFTKNGTAPGATTSNFSVIPSSPCNLINAEINATASTGTPINYKISITRVSTGNIIYTKSQSSPIFKFMFLHPGSYTVSVEVKSANNCSSISTQTIVVNSNNIAGNLSSPTACTYDNVILTYSSTGSNLTQYDWSNGYTTFHPINSTKVYNMEWYHTVLTDIFGCKKRSNDVQPLIVDLPKPAISGKVLNCNGDQLTLNANSGEGFYEWKINGSTFISGNNLQSIDLPPHIMNTNGMYSVMVEVFVTINGVNCSKTSDIFTFSVWDKPQIEIQRNNVNCSPLSAQLDVVSSTLNPLGAGKYQWNNGTPTLYTNSMQITAPGFYYVQYTDNNGCSASASIDIPFAPNFNELSTGCYKLCDNMFPPYTIQGIRGIHNHWQWNDLNLLSIVDQDNHKPVKELTLSPLPPQQAYDLGIFNGMCPYNSKPISIEFEDCTPCIVQEMLQANCVNLSPNTGMFVDNSTYNPSCVISRYDWEFGDGEIASSAPSPNFIIHEYLVSGVYNVKLTVEFQNGNKKTIEIRFDNRNCFPTLCNKPAFPSYEKIPEPCDLIAINNAKKNAKKYYEDYLKDQRDKYDAKYFSKCVTAEPEVTMTYQNGEHHYTVYHYDQADNLVRTTPPSGFDVSGANPPGVHNMPTTYAYNSLNGVIEQETPDAGISKFWYDPLGRVVLSQNSKQKTISWGINEQVSYTLYDDQSRIIEVGEGYYDPFVLNNGSRLALAEFDGNYSLNKTLFNTFGSMYPPANNIVQTFYDKVKFTNNNLQGIFGGIQENLRKRVASVTSEILNDNIETTYDNAIHYSYDINGNVKTMVVEDRAKPAGFQFTRVDYQYDLVSGKVNKVIFQPGKQDQFIHRYTYDADLRIKEVYTSTDGENWQRDANYKYYKHGPLARVEIGENEVQGIDYAYTLQGWLKSINGYDLDPVKEMGRDGDQTNPTLPNNSLFARDAYAYALNYYHSSSGVNPNTADYNPIGTSPTAMISAYNNSANGFVSNASNQNLFNGNIKSTVVSHMAAGTAPANQMGQQYNYDQLNRLKTSTAYLAANVRSPQFFESFKYDANGNIVHLERSGNNSTVPATPDMDDLPYVYQTKSSGTYTYVPGQASPFDATNRLASVSDLIPNGAYTNDIDNNPNNTYEYDNIGNLIKDNNEGIDIDWTPMGKISRISKPSVYEINFKYDPMGNRLSKVYSDFTKIPVAITTTYYSRDAQGNPMATYKNELNIQGSKYTLQDHTIYGSSRLGLLNRNLELHDFGQLVPPLSSLTFGPHSIFYPNPMGGSPICVEECTRMYIAICQEYQIPYDCPLENIEPATALGCGGNDLTYNYPLITGNKAYELTNHLGNVIATISDRKTGVSINANGFVDYFTPVLLSSQDYYAFGSLMPGRSFSGGSGYRFGFNGKENDYEVSGSGNQYDYGFRIYNPRIGRFLSVDPLTKSFPWYTPYQFAGNKPIIAIDLDGLEEFIIHQTTFKNSKGESVLYKVDYRYLAPNERGNRNPQTYMINNSQSLSQIRSTDYDRAYLSNNSQTYQRNGSDNNNSYLRALSNHQEHGGITTQSNGAYGVDILELNTSINFDTDKGLNPQEVSDAFESASPITQQTIDNMVGALINDDNATLSITGFASPKATNLQNTSELNQDNNTQLAQQRAENAKTFIINYAQQAYGKTLNPARISTTSEVTNSAPTEGDNSNSQTDRRVDLKINNTGGN